MIWDPVFGWDWDRIRLGFMFVGFIFLFSGFISATEGGEFLDPTMSLLGFLQKNDIAVLIGTLLLLLLGYSWWRREVGW